MPHKCTKCGKEYADGDARLLQGCECGNNKFLYVPKIKRKKIEKSVKREAVMGIESVRIISPGRYEINLEKILSRNEIIIALREDGRYILHLPSLLKRKDKK